MSQIPNPIPLEYYAEWFPRLHGRPAIELFVAWNTQVSGEPPVKDSSGTLHFANGAYLMSDGAMVGSSVNASNPSSLRDAHKVLQFWSLAESVAINNFTNRKKQMLNGQNPDESLIEELENLKAKVREVQSKKQPIQDIYDRLHPNYVPPEILQQRAAERAEHNAKLEAFKTKVNQITV